MRLKLLIELPDTPGQIINILQPLSSLGANVSTIIHEHDNRTADGKIPVHFTLDGSRQILKKGLDMIRQDKNINIVAIDDVLQKETQTFLLIGDITTDNIKETVHRINDIKDVSIVSVDLNFGNDLQESACKLVVETRNHRKLDTLHKIQELSDENNLILIKEI